MLALVLAARLALAPEAPVSSEVIRSAPGIQTRPTVATNGVDFFAAWEHRRDVIGSRILETGATVDTNLGISLQPTWVYDMRPSVVWNGETYAVVFFSGPHPWPLGAKAVEVTTGGEVIAERQLVTPRDMTSIDVAWNGSAYLVVWRENPGPVRAQFFDRAFGKIGEELAIGDDGIEVSIASNGGNFLVAWTHAAGTHARLVGSDGVLAGTAQIGPSGLDVDVASNGISYAVFASDIVAIDAGGAVTARTSVPLSIAQTAIAASGANWIAVWNANERVMVAELDAGMQFVRDPSRLVARESTQRFPAIAVVGGRSIVLFSDFTHGREYAADVRSAFAGEPSTTRLVSSGLMHQEAADAAWSKATLGVLWYESELFGEGLRFGELASDGTPLRGEGIALADGGDARLASNGHGFAAAVVRSSRVEVDLLPSANTVVVGEIGSGAPLIASDGRDYYVVWTGPNAIVRGRRVGADGALGELHAFANRLSGATSRAAEDIVWNGENYIVLTYETIGTKVVTFTVTATEVSAESEPGPPIVLESGSAYLHVYRGRLAWNGEVLLYAHSTARPVPGVRARVGLSGTDFVVRDGYADLQDVVWDRGEWLYAMHDGFWRLVRGEESVAFKSMLSPRIATGLRTAILTTGLVERIPNHSDQSVRRAFVIFAKPILRRRAVR